MVTALENGDSTALADQIETNEMQQAVHDAFLTLPDAQRQAVTIFYIAAYSQKEIAAFLKVATHHGQETNPRR